MSPAATAKLIFTRGWGLDVLLGLVLFPTTLLHPMFRQAIPTATVCNSTTGDCLIGDDPELAKPVWWHAEDGPGRCAAASSSSFPAAASQGMGGTQSISCASPVLPSSSLSAGAFPLRQDYL